MVGPSSIDAGSFSLAAICWGSAHTDCNRDSTPPTHLPPTGRHALSHAQHQNGPPHAVRCRPQRPQKRHGAAVPGVVPHRASTKSATECPRRPSTALDSPEELQTTPRQQLHGIPRMTPQGGRAMPLATRRAVTNARCHQKSQPPCGFHSGGLEAWNSPPLPSLGRSPDPLHSSHLPILHSAAHHSLISRPRR